MSGDAAFSLLELLVVLALMAALSAAVFHGLGGGGRQAAIRSSQTMLASLANLELVG